MLQHPRPQQTDGQKALGSDKSECVSPLLGHAGQSQQTENSEQEQEFEKSTGRNMLSVSVMVCTFEVMFVLN